MKHSIFQSLTLSMALFTFIAMMFVGVSVSPAFAGTDNEIKAVELELAAVNKEFKRVREIISKLCKEDKESVDLEHYHEKLMELHNRKQELTEKLAQLKGKRTAHQ